MTKESGGRKRKGRKGRKGKGHIIIYTCARERGKGRLKDGSHMQEEEEGTQRGDGIRRRYGGKHGEKKGKVRRGKGHITQHAPILFYKKRRKEDRLTTEADSLLERKGISRRLKRFHSGTETVSVAD